MNGKDKAYAMGIFDHIEILANGLKRIRDYQEHVPPTATTIEVIDWMQKEAEKTLARARGKTP